MADIDVAKVVIHRAGRDLKEWRAVSYGANGEPIAWTETYVDKRDAEAAALTIAAGATIESEGVGRE
jgi:uncharacterized protein YegP (UPF0339 family)